MLKAILFDLDGTLLPMDQDKFTESYFNLLIKKATSIGYEQKKLVQTIWLAISNMLNNTGNKTNETIFWNTFQEKYGISSIKDKPLFDEFYKNEFHLAKSSCNINFFSKKIIDYLKEKQYLIVLATNPIFPSIATEARILWAGLDPSDFTLYTTYENSCFCKPNKQYYKNILKTINCEPSECLMVGNDVDDDMVAKELGIETFLVTDCLINKKNKDISNYNKGSLKDLFYYLSTTK